MASAVVWSASGRAPCLALLGLSLVAAGCEDTASRPTDLTPLETTLAVSLSGSSLLHEPSSPLLTSTSHVAVIITTSREAALYVTTDGSEPRPGASGVSRSPNRRTIDFFAEEDPALERPRVIRWIARDSAGLTSPPRQFEIVFDTEGPSLTYEPPPGTYSSPVVVLVTTEPFKPATLYWTTDGSLPRPDAASSSRARMPVELEIRSTTVLRLSAIDDSGNRTNLEPLRYVIDTSTPTTTAEPDGGEFLGPVQVALRADVPEAEIRYALGRAPEPDDVYEGPFEVGVSGGVFVSADDGLRLPEPVKQIEFVVGPRAATPIERSQSPAAFPVAGGLSLAAALLDASGPLSGRRDMVGPVGDGFGVEWDTWVRGRDAADAFLFQSGVGPHALVGPALGALAGSDARADRERVWSARLAILAAAARAEPPARVAPPTLIYQGARAQLLAPLPEAVTPDGRPVWDDDFGRARWDGVALEDRAVTPDALASGLHALAARARAGLGRRRPVGEDTYHQVVAPVVGLRCGGCHAIGATRPDLENPTRWIAAGILTPGDRESPLIGLLDGRIPHPVAPAPTPQVSAIADWVEDGAPFEPSDEWTPGATGREGFLGYLAVDAAMHLLHHVRHAAYYDAATAELGAARAEPSGAQHVPALARVSETRQDPALPLRVESLRLADARFRTGEQARLLRAAVEWVQFAEQEAELFSGELMRGTAAVRSVPEAALALARGQVAALRLRVWSGTEGLFRAEWTPAGGAAGDVDSAAVADAIVALRYAAAAGVSAGEATSLAAEASRRLRAELFDHAGLVISGRDAAGEPWPVRRTLEVQLAALEALLVEADLGNDASAAAAAEALWKAMDAALWDEANGQWQTSYGQAEAYYGPQLAARVVRTLSRASRRWPLARARLGTFYQSVILASMVLSETWLAGEHGPGPDANGNGIPRPNAVEIRNGVAPVFAREVKR